MRELNIALFMFWPQHHDIDKIRHSPKNFAFNFGLDIAGSPLDFLQHHFVYEYMNRWLREDKDMDVVFPYQMQYMGHFDCINTPYYFHLVLVVCVTIIKISNHSKNLIPKVNRIRQKNSSKNTYTSRIWIQKTWRIILYRWNKLRNEPAISNWR